MERNYEPYISGLMERTRKGKAVLKENSKEQVDELVKAIAFYGTRPDFMRAVAEKTVEESGMGDVEDKIAKIWNKTIGHYREMKDEKSVGLIEFDKEKNIAKYAKPMGVIGALAPVTNAENTAVVKPMNAIKGRNSIILAPHPKAAHVNEFVIEYLYKSFDTIDGTVEALKNVNLSIESGDIYGIIGMSGAGKSTLGKALAEKLDFYFIDNEDMFFPKTDPNYIYASPRTREKAEKMLFHAIKVHENLVFAAVNGDYGEASYRVFHYAVLIDTPKDNREHRVKKRSFQKFGNRMLPGGDLHEQEE